jgi:threonine dehydrogenase-like Zn-dependent dehydrogenase
VARCLIIGCGCRGLALTAALRDDGHAVRATTRDPSRAASLQAAGAEPFVGDPDRIGTIVPALDHVGVLCILLGSATGTAEQLRALHTTRLAMLLEKTLDTTVRGVVYEAAGTVDPALLRAGAGVVASACERSLIPHVLLSADPERYDAWVLAAADAVRRALLARDVASEQALEQVLQDARGRAPDQLVADDERVGSHRQPAAVQTPAGVAGAQVGERQLEHGRDLVRADHPP